MCDNGSLDADVSGGAHRETAETRPGRQAVVFTVLSGVGVVALLGLLYGPIFAWMFERWLHDPFYGHAIAVPVVSAFLLWRKRSLLKQNAAAGSMLGLAAIVAGVVLDIAGRALQIHFVEALSFVPLLWGIIAWMWGWQVGATAAFPVAFLTFMVPLSRMLVEFVAFPLQIASAAAAGGLLGVVGIPVFVSGVDVHVPEYTFEIDVPCSGLQSVIAMGALAALFAYVVRGKLWARVAVFGLSVPVALAANVGRIVTVLLLAMCAGRDVATGFFHGFSSVFVFILAAFGLIAVGRLLGCTTIREDW